MELHHPLSRFSMTSFKSEPSVSADVSIKVCRVPKNPSGSSQLALTPEE